MPTATVGRAPGAPRINRDDLVMVTIAGQVAHPVGRASPYRVSHDGVARVLPGTGGIAINKRIGDRCVGLAGDHVEPGVSLHNNGREVVGGPGGPNRALLTLGCVGNEALVTSGPARGARGIVTGKHGGVDHLLVDFPDAVLRRLRIGDMVQVWSMGQGMRLLDHPEIAVMNCAPRLLARWGLHAVARRLTVPVTHVIPASLLGSGIGRPDTVRGDVDVQLFDPEMRRRHRLGTLRFGDLVALADVDTRLGRASRRGAMTIGVIVHGDSTVSGHGPGVVTLLTTLAGTLRPVIDPMANLAHVLGVRPLRPAREHAPLARGPAATAPRHVTASTTALRSSDGRRTPAPRRRILRPPGAFP